MKTKYNLDYIRNRLVNSPYGYTECSWFRPSDVAPHSSQFKYACEKLYKAGLLDREGDRFDHVGYQYRIRNENSKST